MQPSGFREYFFQRIPKLAFFVAIGLQNRRRIRKKPHRPVKLYRGVKTHPGTAACLSRGNPERKYNPRRSRQSGKTVHRHFSRHLNIQGVFSCIKLCSCQYATDKYLVSLRVLRNKYKNLLFVSTRTQFGYTFFRRRKILVYYQETWQISVFRPMTKTGIGKDIEPEPSKKPQSQIFLIIFTIKNTNVLKLQKILPPD